MKFDNIKLFIKVVQLGSFSSVAKALDIPRSRVSRRIQDLEDALNTKLFYRTTRTISLTSHGESFYRDVIQGVELIDSAVHHVGQSSTEVTGKVKLGLLHSTYTDIQDILFEFQDKHPKVSLDIITVFNGFDDLFEYGLDISFHSGELVDTTLVAKHLLSLQRTLVASKEYVDKRGAPTSVSSLENFETICFRWSNGVVDNTWNIGSTTVTVQPRLIGDNIEVLKSATLAGRGMSILPKTSVLEEVKRGKLVELLCDEQHPIDDIWLLYPPRQNLNVASNALIDWIIECANQRRQK